MATEVDSKNSPLLPFIRAVSKKYFDHFRMARPVSNSVAARVDSFQQQLLEALHDEDRRETYSMLSVPLVTNVVHNVLPSRSMEKFGTLCTPAVEKYESLQRQRKAGKPGKPGKPEKGGTTEEADDDEPDDEEQPDEEQPEAEEPVRKKKKSSSSGKTGNSKTDSSKRSSSKSGSKPSVPAVPSPADAPPPVSPQVPQVSPPVAPVLPRFNYNKELQLLYPLSVAERVVKTGLHKKMKKPVKVVWAAAMETYCYTLLDELHKMVTGRKKHKMGTPEDVQVAYSQLA